jgi:Tfp pilus assembly protein FimT
MLLSLVYAIAMPSLAATRVRASVHNSKHMVVSSISLARTAAIRFGRPAVLRLDSESNRIWVEVDTTLAGGGARDTLEMIWLSQQVGVDLQSNRTGVCFNGRGIGTTGSDCPRAGGVIILSMGARADTVFIGPLGRVVTR